LKVSTLISADLSVGSLIIAAFTSVVITVSSTYSPVPSCPAVDATCYRRQQRREAKRGNPYKLFHGGSPCAFIRLRDRGRTAADGQGRAAAWHSLEVNREPAICCRSLRQPRGGPAAGRR
jgi:hypothetical protein